MPYLVLVRHGQSIGNKEKFFVGTLDSPLSPEGEAQARKAGEFLEEYHFDAVFTSDLQRAWRTAEIITRCDYRRCKELNEKSFGELQGKPYAIMDQYAGERWVGDWDAAPPGGESALDVNRRVIPFYCSTIKPLLLAGKNILVVAHHHSLLAIVREVQGTLEHVHLENAVPRIYELDSHLKVLGTKTE